MPSSILSQHTYIHKYTKVDTENADGGEQDQEQPSTVPVSRENSLPPGVEEEQVPELSNGHKGKFSVTVFL